jgi:hypothetical protein
VPADIRKQVFLAVHGLAHPGTRATRQPQANGMLERLHRQIKEALRARNCGAAWAEHVPWVLLGLRAAPKEEAGVSSAEVAQPGAGAARQARAGASQSSTADAVICRVGEGVALFCFICQDW